MLGLPPKSFDRFKNLLQRQQKKVEADLKAIEKDDLVMTPGLAESSEPGTDSWMADVHTRAVAARHNLVEMLTKTKNALSRLKTGKYGKCENCGKQIEADRLEVIPVATLCMSCSKKIAKHK